METTLYLNKGSPTQRVTFDGLKHVAQNLCSKVDDTFTSKTMRETSRFSETAKRRRVL